jgi:DNA (cytosine-5)-methyltransferase 1
VNNIKPVLLDLYCKAGGATKGYQNAGFYVIGVDIELQPNYCGDEFIQMDALEYLRTHNITGISAIHASPPCQAHTRTQSLAKARNGGDYPIHADLIPETRELLIKSGKPYIIENVVGAPLINPISLSGTQFKNLYTQRKRLFESNIKLNEPEDVPIKKKTPPAGWGFGDDGFISICGSGGVQGMNSKQISLYWGFALGGIDWMARDELAEAIPPAYTEFLGKQIIKNIKENKE